MTSEGRMFFPGVTRELFTERGHQGGVKGYLFPEYAAHSNPIPNPCGLLFLDSKRAGQHLAWLALNPRGLKVHSTFLLCEIPAFPTWRTCVRPPS